jgi:hypothetical protein
MRCKHKIVGHRSKRQPLYDPLDRTASGSWEWLVHCFQCNTHCVTAVLLCSEILVERSCSGTSGFLSKSTEECWPCCHACARGSPILMGSELTTPLASRESIQKIIWLKRLTWFYLGVDFCNCARVGSVTVGLLVPLNGGLHTAKVSTVGVSTHSLVEENYIITRYITCTQAANCLRAI